MEIISKELKGLMIYLRISGIGPTLSERVSYAKAKKLSYEEFLPQSQLKFHSHRSRKFQTQN